MELIPSTNEWKSAPGETIVDIIEYRGWCFSFVANELDLTIDNLSNLITGELEIDEPLANKLSKTFGSTQAFWLERERQFRAK